MFCNCVRVLPLPNIVRLANICMVHIAATASQCFPIDKPPHLGPPFSKPSPCPKLLCCTMPAHVTFLKFSPQTLSSGMTISILDLCLQTFSERANI